MKSKRHTHGGKRPGAGRPQLGPKPKKKITISIDPDDLAKLKLMAGDIKTSKAIEQAVKWWIENVAKDVDLDAVTKGMSEAGGFINDDE
jgi:hypothetical protein